MNEVLKYYTIQKTIDTEVSTIHLTTDDIIITIDKPLAKNVDNIQPLLQAYIDLSDGVPKKFFVDPSAMTNITGAARKKAIPVIKQTCSCFAVILSNPMTRLIMSFMLRVDGLKMPSKGFQTYHEAFVWLRNLTLKEK